MSCSRLVQFDRIEMNRHFDYIFLDEAAAAMEPEAYVPIMGELPPRNSPPTPTQTSNFHSTMISLKSHSPLAHLF
jgi:hypothetical protein